MVVRYALTVLSFVALDVTPAAAQSAAAYYCEPLRVYYPAVPTCPVPWRTVNTAGAPWVGTVPAEPPRLSAAVSGQSAMAGSDAIGELCKTGTSPRTIALCSDQDLRALA